MNKEQIKEEFEKATKHIRISLFVAMVWVGVFWILGTTALESHHHWSAFSAVITAGIIWAIHLVDALKFWRLVKVNERQNKEEKQIP